MFFLTEHTLICVFGETSPLRKVFPSFFFLLCDYSHFTLACDRHTPSFMDGVVVGCFFSHLLRTRFPAPRPRAVFCFFLRAEIVSFSFSPTTRRFDFSGGVPLLFRVEAVSCAVFGVTGAARFYPPPYRSTRTPLYFRP